MTQHSDVLQALFMFSVISLRLRAAAEMICKDRRKSLDTLITVRSFCAVNDEHIHCQLSSLALDRPQLSVCFTTL